MTITVENGTGVAGANSYITADELRAYAEMRGTALGSDDTEFEQYLIAAMDLIESYRAQFQGEKTDSDNPLQWPRSGVFIDGTEIEDDVIPTELKNAQAQFALDAMSNTLQPNVAVGASGAVIEKTIGEITLKYANAEQRVIPRFTKAEAWLAPLCSIRGAVAVRS